MTLKETLKEILESIGWVPARVITIHLPPPPEDLFVWTGTVWIAYYEN